MRLSVRTRLRTAASASAAALVITATALFTRAVDAANADAATFTAVGTHEARDRRIVPDPRDESVAAALRTLSSHVKRSSHPEALSSAFRAYYSYRDARPDVVRNPYLYFVDLGLNNSTPRGYVFDMRSLMLIEGPFHVAHGTGSSAVRNGVPTRFSNRPGSNASSLGLYVAQETYRFSGRANGRAYTSVGLRMRGESGEFNDAARRRGIVAHGAPYVTGTDAGRSEGCPAMEQHRAQRLLPMIADGGIVFIYSPHDTRWIRSDPWVNYAD
jgi:hypothetical protein